MAGVVVNKVSGVMMLVDAGCQRRRRTSRVAFVGF